MTDETSRALRVTLCGTDSKTLKKWAVIRYTVFFAMEYLMNPVYRRVYLLLATVSVTILTSACTMMAGPVSGSAVRAIDTKSNRLVMLRDGPYVQKMIDALSQAGFSVTGNVPATQGSSRYGVRFNIELSQTVCVFTDHFVGNATLTLIDMESGQAVGEVRQRGATGPCTTVDPVYPGIASELRKIWTREKNQGT